jgi:hypothetical protein
MIDVPPERLAARYMSASFAPLADALRTVAVKPWCPWCWFAIA